MRSEIAGLDDVRRIAGGADCFDDHVLIGGLVIKGDDGEDVDLFKIKSETKSKKREYEVIKDSDKMQGILTKDTYMCPKCDSVEVFAYLEQTRSSDEPETRMLTCKDCGHGWREY